MRCSSLGSCLTLAAVAMLAACGGGDDAHIASSGTGTDGGGAGVSSGPAGGGAGLSSGPAGLTQLSDFPTLGFDYRFTTNSDGSNPQGPTSPDATDTISFSYRASDESYEIAIPGLSPGRLVQLAGNAYGTSHALSPSPTATFEVMLFRPGATNPALPLNYTSFGEWEDPIYTPLPSALRSNNVGNFAYGVPSEPSEVPVAGTVSYSGLVTGRTSASLGVWYVFGTASLTFDFSSGALSGDLDLGVNPGGPGHTHFGDFPFAAANYIVGGTRFSGHFRMPDGSVDGFFEGQFTGPQASELMVRWLLPQAEAQGSLFGISVGTRKANRCFECFGLLAPRDFMPSATTHHAGRTP